MLTPTHLLTAQTTFLLTCISTGHAPSIAEGCTALVASLIPDLDSRQSYIGRGFRPLASWVEDTVGHRTLTHSLLVQAFVGVIAWYALPFGFFLAIVAGWLSHSIADMITPSGVCWFWPSRVRCVLPGNARYRMASMGQGELWFLVLMGLSGMALMPLAATGENTTGLIRSAIGAIESARRNYDAHKGEWAYQLEIAGKDNRSYADISGRYYVIGPWQESGFLVETDDGARSVCQTQGCDWYADRATLKRDKPEITTTMEIKRQHLSAQLLVATLEPLTTHGRVYVSGSALTGQMVNAPPTLLSSGENLKARFASIEHLRLLKRPLRQLSLRVQIRHEPGTAVPKLQLPEETPSDDNPLDRWLPR